MERVAFRMTLLKGKVTEYKKRHDEIWPELSSLLKMNGISDYAIFLEESSGQLFGVLKIENSSALDQLPQEPIMKKWWTYMKDLMVVNADDSPVSIPLREVFYLP